MKCDDGSYIECASLTLNGKSDGSCVLYLGNAACVNCLGNISIDNFGVWGPSCTSCTTTEGVKGTYLLDHVELVLPSTFPTVFTTNALNVWAGTIKGVGIGSLQPAFVGYHNLRMFYYWMNGYEGKMLNPDNYQWDTSNKKLNLVWNNSLPTGASGIDASNQTCTYSTSASYDYAHFDKGTNAIPEAGGVFYAFETAENSLRDFDYNDVVLFVNTPADDGNGYTSLIQVMAVGNTTKTLVSEAWSASASRLPQRLISCRSPSCAKIRRVTPRFPSPQQTIPRLRFISLSTATKGASGSGPRKASI